MKLSENKTNWLIIKACIGSEWDNATFLLLELTEDYTNTLKQRSKLAQSLEDDPDFVCLTYWDSPKGWYKLFNEFEEIIEAFENGEFGWSFLSPDDEDEIKHLVQMKEPIETQRIDIYPDGEDCITGRGEITDELYWTLEFSIDKL